MVWWCWVGDGEKGHCVPLLLWAQQSADSAVEATLSSGELSTCYERQGNVEFCITHDGRRWTKIDPAHVVRLCNTCV